MFNVSGGWAESLQQPPSVEFVLRGVVDEISSERKCKQLLYKRFGLKKLPDGDGFL